MPELLEQLPPGFFPLPIVLNGELTDYFDSPDLLEESLGSSPESEATPSSEPYSSAQFDATPAALAVAQVADIAFTPRNPDKISLRDRFYRSRFGRLALGSLTALGLASGGVAVEASPAFAATNPVYTVTNYDHDGTHGIYYRNSPSMADSIRQLPYYARYGDRIELICGTNGEAVGEKYHNRRWHLVRDLDNRAAPNEFYIPDHDTNTPNKANQPTPGESECGGGNPNLGNQTVNPQPAETVRPFTTLNRNVTASWARDHAEDKPPEAGACTQFVSRALWQGGIPQTSDWNSSWLDVSIQGGDIKRRSVAAWSAPDLITYLRKQPYAEFVPLTISSTTYNVPKAKKGDIIAYDWSGDGTIDHLAMVVGSAGNNPEYPLVAEWGVYGSRPTNYTERGWSWSKKNNSWLQAEDGQQGMRAYLLHFRSEDDL